MMMLHSVWSGGGFAAARRKVMVALALLALVAGLLVWASPGSQAQANQAPFADAGVDQTLNPGAAVVLTGVGSVDVDDDGDAATACTGCEYEWEVETGPYDWIQIGEDATTATDNAATPAAAFEVPSEAFVDKVADSDPQKYEIVVRLTVTDNDGATDSDTVSININQRPVADIGVYAGLRDEDITDGDLGAHGHFPIDAVIDGPGENGNRDNEWDIMEGAYLQLDGSASTDENPLTGRPSAYQWTRVRPASADGYAGSQSVPSASPRLDVAIALSDSANVEVINFGDLDGDGTANEAGDSTADPPQVAETISVAKLPDVAPNMPQTVFYQLTVCDSRVAATASITDPANCDGRTGATLIRIVVHDTSATPEVSFNSRTGAVLTTQSDARGDAAPQSTVSQFTGVENQFIVAAGSTVLLTATVEDDDQEEGHNFRWSGATGVPGTATATVRVPADADDGDTIDGSVTVTDATRISVTATFQLLVGENTAPTAGGVPANMGTINLPAASGGGALISVHSVTDGFQNPRDGSTVTLRGVGNDADGDSIITAWALREGPNHSALEGAISAWVAAINAIDRTGTQDAQDIAKAAADALDIGGGVTVWQVVAGALQDMQEPDMPLFELNGALTDTVSFDVPNLENGEDAGTILLFNVIDSNGVADAQIVYVHVSADDNVPNADAGDDRQVDPEAFVRLNGSASSDPDVGDGIDYEWTYVGATMDPAPDERSPLSDDEVDELDGWILNKADDGTWTYIVKSDGTRADNVADEDFGKLQSTTSPYPYFDAPDLSGFNNLKLTFRLKVSDRGGTDLNNDGDTEDTEDDVDETELGFDVNNDGDAMDEDVDGVVESTTNGNDYDTVVVTVVNRFFSGDVSGPDFCTAQSLGGPQTYPFDSDGDGVADTCSLNTTRRATVARQNALETLANLNPTEFRGAVLGVCGAAGFKQADYGDDPADLDADVCETERVSPPPAAADPATADEFFSGAIAGPDFCTNHSLGGARTYAFDSDGDGVADVCSLPTTKREAIARQRALETFIVAFTGADELAGLKRLIELSDGIAGGETATAEYGELYNSHVDGSVDGHTTALTEAEKTAAETSIENLEATQADATRYSNALGAACRALGSQDFGDAASALARDACAPASGPTGRPLT